MPRQKTLNTSEFNLLKCKVCEGKSDGNHYGIVCCFKCKTFYRRAVLNRQTPDCILKEPPCTNPKKLCRGCRYKKCLKMGMSKSALQPKRDIIGVGVRKPLSNELVDNLTDFEKQHLELINRLTKLDNNIRIKKFEVIESKKAAKRLADQIKGASSSENDDLQLMAKSDVSIDTQIGLISMIEWTETIEEFCQLPLKDRIFLTKRFSSQYLTLENGFFTALQSKKKENIYQISTGSFMPRDIQMLKDKNLLPARLWRQEKLWSNMVSNILDEVVNPLKVLAILPQEMLALKVLIFFNCGNHNHEEDNTLPISATTRKKMIECKHKIILGLFAFYKSKNQLNYAERFSNMILLISGILSASNVLLETYQIMRLFNFAQFDCLAEQMLFGADEINKLKF